MSAPAPPPSFIPPPPFVPANDSIGFWPAIPIDNEQPRPTLQPSEIPPFKRPKTSEDNLPGPLMNQNKNPRMPPPVRGTSKIFFKTRPCDKHRLGLCPYGDNCNFAHGMQDMRKPPPNWQEIVGSNGDDRSAKWEDDQKIITRHRLCKNFYNGKVCPYGERCNYLHEDPRKFREEFERFRESSVISISTSGAPVDIGPRSEQLDNVITVTSKTGCWKTRMCNKWETSGNCPFGDKCHFAHGQAELQKFGGHQEMEMGNVRAPPKPLASPVNDASLNNTAAGASCETQVLQKILRKWKGLEKINRIYADWIDDIPLAKKSPSKQES